MTEADSSDFTWPFYSATPVCDVCGSVARAISIHRATNYTQITCMVTFNCGSGASASWLAVDKEEGGYDDLQPHPEEEPERIGRFRRLGNCAHASAILREQRRAMKEGP